jgi:Uma2 family endonuclease
MPSSVATSAPFPRPEEMISWENFQREYLSREDGYTYEWLNGKVERTPNAMNAAQLYILNNLLNFFMRLKFKGQLSGQLMPESDLFFGDHHRRPDVCWLTDQQINALAEKEYEVPAFVIEVISNHDEMNTVVSKMQDYRSAGVQVVWHILPNYEEVHVYKGQALEEMKVCKGEERCEAAPALPHFNIKASEIFYREKAK